MRPVAIFLYELSGRSAEPFAAAGWDCYCIDIQHPGNTSQGNIHFIKADARRWKPTRDMVERCRFFAAFPPCDDLAISGARWFKGKGLHRLSDAIELFAVAAEWAEFFEVPYLIENPRSTISTYWRKADHSFDPADYSALEPSDHYTKKTMLWTGGGFVMPPKRSLPGPVAVISLRNRCFVPAADLKAKSDSDRAPYQAWADDDLIALCPGGIIDEGAVRDHIVDLCATYDVAEIAVDPALARVLMQHLSDAGLPVFAHPQSALVMSEASGNLIRTVNGEAIRHNGDPVLRSHFDNVAVSTNPQSGLVRMHKQRSNGHIDAAVASAMAVSRAVTAQNKKSRYADPDVLGLAFV